MLGRRGLCSEDGVRLGEHGGLSPAAGDLVLRGRDPGLRPRHQDLLHAQPRHRLHPGRARGLQGGARGEEYFADNMYSKYAEC